MKPFFLTFLLMIPFSSPIAAELSPRKGYRLIDRLYSERAGTREKARDELIAANDITLAPALVDAIFFNVNGLDETVAVLTALTKQDLGPDYKGWITYLGSREDIQPKPGYLAHKAKLFAKIDPAFAEFLDEDFPRTIRPIEIVYGGVKKDGIPALENPPFVAPDKAPYLQDDESVFGVVINGDVRAYPHRIMDWHEMANDVVGGIPVSLSYCTLCGSGILFDTRRPSGGSFTFGSSGMLYRSNKLMYDRQTNNLWSNLTGEPVMGNLVNKGIVLPVLPLTVTTWGEWKAKHPNTKVMSWNTGFSRDYRPGAAYGSYFNSPETMFPVWNAPSEDKGIKAKDWLWVAVLDGKRKAFPLKNLVQEPFKIDDIGGKRVALITDPRSQAVRVFSIGDKKLVVENGQVRTEAGVALRFTENALVSEDGAIGLPRVPGHRIYWFAWGSFFPDGPTAIE